jgi:hypothetical protein
MKFVIRSKENLQSNLWHLLTFLFSRALEDVTGRILLLDKNLRIQFGRSKQCNIS